MVYLRRFDFDQGREASILAGQNLIPLYNQLGPQNLLNYVQNSHGFNVSVELPSGTKFLPPLGITYGYDISNIVTQTTAATNYFQYINFSGVAGPNALNGIHTSSITPSLRTTRSTTPLSLRGAAASSSRRRFPGASLGGNVNTIRPTVDFKYFKRAPWHKTHILAFHAMYVDHHRLRRQGDSAVLAHVHRRRAGRSRIRNLGHHADRLHRFQHHGPRLNNDGSQRMQKVVSGGLLTSQPVSMNVPSYQLITPGGDWQSVGNFEYRIPIVGPVTLALSRISA